MAAIRDLEASLYSVTRVGFPDVWKCIREDNTRAADRETITTTTTTTTTCSLLNKIQRCWPYVQGKGNIL